MSEQHRKKISENYYNCGGGIKNSISILELIDILQRYNKKKASVRFKKERKADQKIFVSNNNNLYKDFHWYPKINRHEGVKKLYIWIKENLGIFKKIYNK